ncbi:MAG: SH3 domain-containing protein, partial [Anaerolineae bacterium]|nr:SH3 domain-containing protein [Anaerolineae bacterium]
MAVQYGMNINPQGPGGQPDAPEDLKSAAWVRYPFLKADLRYDTLARAYQDYDPIVDQYHALDVRSLIVLNQQTFSGPGGRAPWGYGGTWPEYAQTFAAECGQIAAHYKGKNVAYEIWNEGDIQGAASVYVAPTDFAPVLGQAAAAIRAADPDAPVVFGGLAAGAGDAVKYVQEVQSALGGSLPVDAIGVHPYGQWPPTMNKPNIPTGWFGTLDAAMHTYINGFGGVPIWITEIGVSEANPIDQPYWAAIADYMRAFCAYVEVNYSDHVPVLVWFAWSDIMRNAGITRNNQPKQPIYDTFFEIARAGASGALQPARPKTVVVGVLTPTTTDPTLKVRQGPSTGAAILDQVVEGDRLAVLEDWGAALAKIGPNSQQWVNVRSPKGIAGWCAGWYLRTIEEAQPAVPETEKSATEPTVPPQAGGAFQNGSFEEGWTDMPPTSYGLVNQQPKGWALRWQEPGETLFDSAEKVTGIPECVHKLAGQLPPNEQLGAENALILDGSTTYKIFNSAAVFGAELRQTVTHLAPGSKGVVKAPIFISAYDAQDPYAAEAGLWVNSVGGWQNLATSPHRTWFTHKAEFTVPDGGAINILIRVKSKWRSPVDFFIDNVTMEITSTAAAATPPPPADIPTTAAVPTIDTTTVTTAAPPPSTTPALRVTPTAYQLKIRSGPATTYPILAVVDPGDVLAVLEDESSARAKLGQDGQWINVRTPSGAVGYSAAWYLAVVEADAPPPVSPPTPPAPEEIPASLTVTPTAPELKVRAGAGTQYDILAVVNPGDHLDAIEEWSTAAGKLGHQDQWLKVRTAAGVIGWSAAWYLKTVDPGGDETPEPWSGDLYPAPMADYVFTNPYGGPNGHKGWDLAKEGEPIYCGPNGGYVIRALTCTKCTEDKPSTRHHTPQPDLNAVFNDPAWGYGFG